MVHNQWFIKNGTSRSMKNGPLIMTHQKRSTKNGPRSNPKKSEQRKCQAANMWCTKPAEWKVLTKQLCVRPQQQLVEDVETSLSFALHCHPRLQAHTVMCDHTVFKQCVTAMYTPHSVQTVCNSNVDTTDYVKQCVTAMSTPQTMSNSV